MNEEILTQTEITEAYETSEPTNETDAEPIEEPEVSEEPHTQGEPQDTAQATADSLRAELDALRAELLEERAALKRISCEIGEFSDLFPAVSLSGIPDSVWQSVKNGVPLAAAYALFEKKAGLIKADANQVNKKNSSSSTGPIGKESASDFFSPEDVRAMSRDEVRKNYTKILESMKKWN